ncbi:MAG: adenylate/guanylate cyclase domain-containing protein [Rhodospirillaceae bacterium]|nr:adenylate/guanylate cyclase domain-containing protein [Rhodospirillaceae bacterium]
MAIQLPTLAAVRSLFDGRPTAELSDRVRAAIRRQEEFSEILIGWAQLAIVSLFAILYAVTPRAGGSVDTMFEPVPLALLAYLAFTVLRLVLAYRRYMPAWFLYLSAVVDMALLMALIWSFHIQYGQPPSFYLKAPTLLYVFIFIALRALRFDPHYVFAAGLVAATGWLLLLGLALVAATPGAITRDYVGYMTSNHILIGAEIDKIVSILVVTLVLTVALSRGRRLLVASVREATVAQDLRRFFAPEIARAITDARMEFTAGQGEVRDAAILMIDIRGFSRHAAAGDPSEVIRLLAQYQSFMVPAVHRNGGTIDKFLGDGIMATFGAAQPSDSCAADALRAVEDVLEQAARWNAFRAQQGRTVALAVNAAVATGSVIFGTVGDASRLEYTVIGDAVNRATKLEDHNKAVGSRAVVPVASLQRAEAQGYRPTVAWQTRPGEDVVGLPGRQDLAVVV